MPSQLNRLTELLLDVFFPKRCVGCGLQGDFLCKNCRRTLVKLGPALCPRCGRPQISKVVCPDCLKSPHVIDGIRSPFRFTGPIKQAVYEFKYNNLRSIGEELAGLLFEYMSDNPLPADVLVPVPLHPARLKNRGYNQSALLAKGLARISGLPLVQNCLIRNRDTRPQVKTRTVLERQQNIRGAFNCITSDLSARRVLIIDDVATSGLTLDSCAGALKEAGAISVWGLTLAREI